MALQYPLPGGFMSQDFGPSFMELQPSMWYRQAQDGEIESAWWTWYAGANRFSVNVHAGVDYAGRVEGSPLVAAEAGRIVRKEFDYWNGGGYVIRVAIRPGVYYEYNHCSRLSAKAIGQVVRRGEVIAWVGKTGNVTGVHVHVNMIINDYFPDVGITRPMLRDFADFLPGGQYQNHPKIRPLYV
jgi:murein DD-endopeptidase MepM/ murein hydrolase activator NlpD